MANRSVGLLIAVRDIIGTSIYFSAYETAKHVCSTVFRVEPTHNAVVYAGGGVSGIASWVLICEQLNPSWPSLPALAPEATSHEATPVREGRFWNETKADKTPRSPRPSQV